MSDRKSRLAIFTMAVAVLVATPLTLWASDAFNDVSDSNVHHDDITWLAEAGVTFGCNPPSNTEFCPAEPVLRQQMASFMRRLAENEIVNAATAIEADHAVTADHATTAGDAATLNGLEASQLMPRAAFNASSDLPNQDTNLETTITAPGPGVLVVTGAVEAYNVSGGSDVYDCYLSINGAQVVGTRMIARMGPNNNDEDCTTSGAANVPAGTHTVALEVVSVGNTALVEASVTAIWVPLDGSGEPPTDVTPLADPPAEDLSDRTR